MTDTGATRAMLSPQGQEFEWQARQRRFDFALAEAKETFAKYFPGLTGKDKQTKIEISEALYHVKSWEGVSQLPLEVLEPSIKVEQEGTPSLLERRCIEKAEALASAAQANG